MDSHKSSKKSLGGHGRGSPERGRSESPKSRKSRKRSRSRERAHSHDSRESGEDNGKHSNSKLSSKRDDRRGSPSRSGKRRSRSPPARSRSRSPRSHHRDSSSKSKKKDKEREKEREHTRGGSRSPRRSKRSASRSPSPRSKGQEKERGRHRRDDKQEKSRGRSRSRSPRHRSSRHSRSPSRSPSPRRRAHKARPPSPETIKRDLIARSRSPITAITPPAASAANPLALFVPPTVKHWSPKRTGTTADETVKQPVLAAPVASTAPAPPTTAAPAISATAPAAAAAPAPAIAPAAAAAATVSSSTATTSASTSTPSHTTLTSTNHSSAAAPSPALGVSIAPSPIPPPTPLSTHPITHITHTDAPAVSASPLLSGATSMRGFAMSAAIVQTPSKTSPIIGDAGWPTETADDYELLEQIGEGTFGQVYRGRHRRTGEVVALKKIRMDNEREGFPITALREIRLLRQLQHSSIVRLLNVVSDTPALDPKLKASFYLVFEYMDHDLSGLLESGLVRLTHDQIRVLFRNLVEGLEYCHAREILHRDIKGSNLLVDRFGHLKLADFGLARRFAPDETRAYTNRVITLWYRPPELLLGSILYGGAVDMWSAGCILGELFESRPILRTDTELEQLEAVFRLCGSPTPETWPGVAALPHYATCRVRKDYPRRIAEQFASLPPDALNLLDRLLALDPDRRLSAAAALKHPFLATATGPGPDLRLAQDCHELFLKRKRKARQGDSDGRAGSVPLNGGPAGPPGDAVAFMPPFMHPGPGGMPMPLGAPPHAGLPHPHAHVPPMAAPPLPAGLPPQYPMQAPPAPYGMPLPPGPGAFHHPHPHAQPPGHQQPPPRAYHPSHDPYPHDYDQWQPHHAPYPGPPLPPHAHPHAPPAHPHLHPPHPHPHPHALQHRGPPEHNGDYYHHAPQPAQGYGRPPPGW
eukprot:m.154818 g.154818  ORF g.154818 m.154818 type:complete len:926 (+) comp15138_c7_seq1:56-2833(+)